MNRFKLTDMFATKHCWFHWPLLVLGGVLLEYPDFQSVGFALVVMNAMFLGILAERQRQLRIDQ